MLTELLHWRWIFGINVPLAAAVVLRTPRLLPADGPRLHIGRLDLPGAALLTAGPLSLVYGVLESAPLAVAAGVLLLVAFVVVEARTRRPLVPLSFFTHRTRAVANAVTVLLSAALSTAFLLLTLYMQDVIGFGPLQAGLAFLPFCAALFFAISQVPRLIGVLGMKYTAMLGLAFTTAGLAWLARLPDQGAYAVDVLPGMVGVAPEWGSASLPCKTRRCTASPRTTRGLRQASSARWISWVALLGSRCWWEPPWAPRASKASAPLSSTHWSGYSQPPPGCCSRHLMR
ncbi:hypothetical protein [Streptomyces zagrosensis]|uniref:Putative MFS family arabinose efflux permease n=1 Tax=Streptomyces zagrosensis TaxID=1042984 RepID=A0A7W9QF16_9ACTN|nr:hypothetical protein [Streptomyces zagrosensis]MBB5938779.1 putative MFS family arabinose efflux permease [Streptomyces zagrosensis]